MLVRLDLTGHVVSRSVTASSLINLGKMARGRKKVIGFSQK